MKVLLDTNIIIDHALQRQPFWEASEQILAAIEQKQIEGYIIPRILTPEQLIEELRHSTST